ncbi:hypothetical protein [Flavobacterium sp. LC2016-12]|uniref:hypothetical protein n=1 Tax=Flavobacterium sp. LC2016-12 TaxID=2783794 RepID=UPI00188CCB2A|nr:hypothetical protein [Flavobacterium sp. LC2016-12]MBF4465971.1 hypothetical protein [Flavobacterium sp. LC2016-12]
MKINKAIFFAFFLIVINISSVFAEDPHPPSPDQSKTAKGGGAINRGIGVPGSPIDQSLVYLVVAGLALGIGMIYKDKVKKASL